MQICVYTIYKYICIHTLKIFQNIKSKNKKVKEKGMGFVYCAAPFPFPLAGSLNILGFWEQSCIVPVALVKHLQSPFCGLKSFKDLRMELCLPSHLRSLNPLRVGSLNMSSSPAWSPSHPAMCLPICLLPLLFHLLLPSFHSSISSPSLSSSSCTLDLGAWVFGQWEEKPAEEC